MTASQSSQTLADSLRQWIVRHPVAAFLVWFFTVGQSIAFIPVILDKAFDVSTNEAPFIMLGTVLGLLLPAFVITWLVNDREGVRQLWRNMTRMRVPLAWYALAVVVVPGLTWAISAATSEPSDDVTGSSLFSALAVGLALQTVVALLSINLWEEVAWTGFVQARLQATHSPLRAACITAPFFALGHLPLAFQGTLTEGVTFMALVVLLAFPFRALQGWVYNRTSSLLLVGLLHAAGNAVALGSVAGVGFIPRLYEVPGQSLLAFAILGIVATVVTRGRLGRKIGSDANAATPRNRVSNQLS